MYHARWGRRVLAGLAVALAGLPAAHAGPGHGDVFTATPQGIPTDANVAAFALAPAFLAGEVRISSGLRVRVCAYTVTDALGAPVGVRTIAAAYRASELVTTMTDDVFTELEPSGFVYKREPVWYDETQVWSTLRLFVTLPRVGGFMELYVGTPTPGREVFAFGPGYYAEIQRGHLGFKGSAVGLGSRGGFAPKPAPAPKPLTPAPKPPPHQPGS